MCFRKTLWRGMFYSPLPPPPGKRVGGQGRAPRVGGVSLLRALTRAAEWAGGGDGGWGEGSEPTGRAWFGSENVLPPPHHQVFPFVKKLQT